MSKRKKLLFTSIGAIILIIILGFSGVRINNQIEWEITKNVIATSGFPIEIGLTNTVVINCFTTGNPPICVGGTLCPMKDAAQCIMYSDVSGMGSYAKANAGRSDFEIAMTGTTNALFSNIAIGQAGLTSGGQLIAGCMSNVLCDNGVLASSGGCYNCMAKADWRNNLKTKFKYFIAGFKE